MKKTLMTSLFVALLGAAVPALALRVAMVDIKEAFDKYQGTTAAKDKLKKQAESAKAKLEKDQDKLKKKMEDLQAQKKALAESKYAEREQAVMGEVRQLKSEIDSVQNDLSSQEQKMTEQLLKEIREVVQKVADREKYDFVFEKSTLLFGGTEITASVLKELNSK